jgi:hypothetical protein
MPKGTLLRIFGPSLPTITLATLHIILCFAVDATSSSNDPWAWFFVAVIDLPASNWIKQLGPPFASFLILGTLWWYCIGIVVQFFHVVFTANKNST